MLPPPLPGFQRPFPIRRLDPLTASDRMLGLCGWATALGLIGLATALRGLLTILAGTAPGWYEPTLAGLGSAAIGLTAAAFPVIRRPRLPWLLLCLATASVLVDVGLTVGAR